MEHKLIQLAKILSSAGLDEEADETLGLISPPSDVSKWKDAWNSVNKPFPKQFPGRAIAFISEGVSNLIDAGSEFKDADPQELQRAGNIVKKMSNEIDYETLKKYSKYKEYKGIHKDSNLKLLNTIPFVGPIFSAMFAFKNIYYGIQELRRVFSFSEKLSIPWHSALNHKNLSSLFETHKNDPDKIAIVDQLSKASRVFWDEFISLVINSIDLIKDILFIIAEILTAGWAVWLDVSLSFLFMGIEMAVESVALKPFIGVIDSIKASVRESYSNSLNSASREERRNLHRDLFSQPQQTNADV